MAENKKSFVLYCDLVSMVEKLPDETAGKLFKIILEYVNDKSPLVDDLLLQIAFEPIKSSLKRDLKEWEETRVFRSESGKLGGIKSGQVRKLKKQNEANEASASNLKQTKQVLKTTKQNEANEAVSVSVTVNDTVTVNGNVINSKNFVLFEIYKSFETAKTAYPKTTKPGFDNWRKFIDFVYANHFEEIFIFRTINPADFSKLDFPEEKWEEVLRSILSTGIKEEHNLFYRIPQFIGYTKKHKSNGLNGTKRQPQDVYDPI